MHAKGGQVDGITSLGECAGVSEREGGGKMARWQFGDLGICGHS